MCCSRLSAQEPARIGKTTAIAPSLFSFEPSAQLGGARRRIKSPCWRRRWAKGEPWVAITTRQRSKTSAADNAVDPADLGASSLVGCPIAAWSATETLEQVATDAVVRCVKRSQADATGSPERPSTAVQMPCAANPGVVCHQMRAFVGAERAQRQRRFQEHTAWISRERHAGTVGRV